MNKNTQEWCVHLQNGRNKLLYFKYFVTCDKSSIRGYVRDWNRFLSVPRNQPYALLSHENGHRARKSESIGAFFIAQVEDYDYMVPQDPAEKMQKSTRNSRKWKQYSD
jgi:hypothetical protein